MSVKLEKIGETQQWQIVGTPLPDEKGERVLLSEPSWSYSLKERRDCLTRAMTISAKQPL